MRVFQHVHPSILLEKSFACSQAERYSIFVYYREETALSNNNLTKGGGGFPTYIRLPIHAQFFRVSRTAQYPFYQRSLIMMQDYHILTFVLRESPSSYYTFYCRYLSSIVTYNSSHAQIKNSQAEMQRTVEAMQGLLRKTHHRNSLHSIALFAPSINSRSNSAEIFIIMGDSRHNSR